MSACAVVAWSLVVLAACIVGVVAISRAISRQVSRSLDEEWDPY